MGGLSQSLRNIIHVDYVCDGDGFAICDTIATLRIKKTYRFMAWNGAADGGGGSMVELLVAVSVP